MNKKRHERPWEVIAGIEAVAKRLRAEVHRATREPGLTNHLELAMLRKEAARIAELIEQYVRALRVELMRAPAAPPRARRAQRAA